MNTFFTNDTKIITNTTETIDEMFNTLLQDDSIKFDSDRLYYDLFQNNNYHPSVEAIQAKLPFVQKDFIAENILDTEKFISTSLNNLNGRNNIVIDDKLSKILYTSNLQDISIKDFQYLPFNSFNIILNDFDDVENVLVYKKDNNICFHFHQVGKEKVSLQMLINEDGIEPQHSYSSLYYHREISPISNETQLIGSACFKYVVSLILYMIEYKNNQDIVVKDMRFDNLNNRLSTKQKSKKKYVQKLQSKSNTINLKFAANSIKYINSISRRRKNKKITKEISVRGFFKNQPIGKRGSGKTKRIWVEPFKKCVQKEINNRNHTNKVYMVS